MDRSSQYQPIETLLPQLKAAREAADNATGLVAANASAITTTKQKWLALAQKVQPWGGATSQDFIDYGNTLNTLNQLESATPSLQGDATSKVLVFRGMWQQGNGLFQALLQDPGMQEQV